MIQCSIIYDDAGNVSEVLAPNGLNSSLYEKLLQISDNDSKQALGKWAATYTKTFIKEFGNWEAIKRVYDNPSISSSDTAIVYSQQPTSDVRLETLDNIRFVDTRIGFLDFADSRVANLVKLYNNANRGENFKLDYNDPNLAVTAKKFFDFAAVAKVRGFYAGPTIDSNVLVVLDNTAISGYNKFSNSLDANGEPILFGTANGFKFNPLQLPKLTTDEIRNSAEARARFLVNRPNIYVGMTAQSAIKAINKSFGKTTTPDQEFIGSDKYTALANEVRQFNTTAGLGFGKIEIRQLSSGDYKLAVSKTPLKLTLSPEESLNLSAIKEGINQKIKDKFLEYTQVEELNQAFESVVDSYIRDISGFNAKGVTIESISNAYSEAQDKLLEGKTSRIQFKKNDIIVTNDGQIGYLRKVDTDKFTILNKEGELIEISKDDVKGLMIDDVPVSLKLDADFKESFNISKSVIERYIEDPQKVAESISNVRDSDGNFVKFDQNFLNALKCK